MGAVSDKLLATGVDKAVTHEIKKMDNTKSNKKYTNKYNHNLSNLTSLDTEYMPQVLFYAPEPPNHTQLFKSAPTIVKPFNHEFIRN